MNLEIAFQMMDSDRDGNLTIQELKDAFELHSKKDEKLWDQIMKQVDRNKDGNISFEEFTEVMNKVIEINYSDLSKMLNAIKSKFKTKLRDYSL